jgi:hypothetical protein
MDGQTADARDGAHRMAVPELLQIAKERSRRTGNGLLTNVVQYRAYTRRPVSCIPADNRSRYVILHRQGLCRAYTRRPVSSSLGGIHSMSHGGGRKLVAPHHDLAGHRNLEARRNLAPHRDLAAHGNLGADRNLAVRRDLAPHRNLAARRNLGAADNNTVLAQARTSQARVHQ